MKRISVIIPVYNAEKYLEKCVESIAPQLDERDEIILVNDGSRDNSLVICNQLKEKYPIIVVIDQENSGPAIARNNAIEISQGKYLTFVDSDDYVEDGYFADYLQKIEETGADVVVGGYKRVEAQPYTYIHTHTHTNGQTRTECKTLFEVKSVDSEWFPFVFLSVWSRMYNGDFIRRNNIRFPERKLGEDVLFNIHAYTKSKRICVVKNWGYCYMENSSGLSGTLLGKITPGHVEMLNEIYLLAGDTDDLMNLYYVKTVIYYLLAGARRSNRKVFLNEYRDNFNWLKEHNIPAKFPFFSSKVKGEPIIKRIIIFIFFIIHRMRLMPLFALIFCRGKDE